MEKFPKMRFRLFFLSNFRFSVFSPGIWDPFFYFMVRTSFFKGAQGRKRNSVTNIKAAHEPSTCATACNKAKGKRRNRTARVSQNCRNVPSVFFFFFRGFVPFHRLFKWIAQKKNGARGRFEDHVLYLWPFDELWVEFL